MSESIKKTIEALRQKLRHHDYAYYILSEPEISDKEYDALLDELKGLEERYPEYKSGDSPTMRVGGGIQEGFKTVAHMQKMLSLDNTYSVQELGEWEERVRKGVAQDEKIEYVVELKIDGVSANLTYERGRLKVAATRGDGETGEDVTVNIKTIRAVPLVFLGSNIPERIEIRGEVYMERRDFQAYNRERERQDEPLFANPRNAASGSLKLLDSSLVAERKLNFFAHSLGAYKGLSLTTQWDYFEQLKKWGVRVSPHAKLCKSLKEAVGYCSYWQEKRDTLSFEVDGIVIKVNSLAQQRSLATTHKSPRWAVAYKFPARQATTEVVKININVGRTGVITPAAELKPVECSGVVIRHATLHNFDEIKRLNIREGDRVLIERAGDVIPKVLKVIESRGKKPFLIPARCPVCAGKVIKEKEEDVAYRCINPSCPAQLERGLLHFASRQAMDIEGLGEAVVAQLVNLKLVHTFSDIYALTAKELAKLDLFKEKKIDNLLESIRRSKEKPLSRLIYALGIRHIGEKAAYVLAKHFRSIETLLAATREDFDALPEIGPIIAESVVRYFSLPQTRKLIKELREAELCFREEAREAAVTALTGKTLVFTGELEKLGRSQAEELARIAGGNVSSNVSKATDFVVAGKSPGSKYNKAKELGVKIIREKEFEEMLK
jgi:DNA ligase (NAD+)